MKINDWLMWLQKSRPIDVMKIEENRLAFLKEIANKKDLLSFSAFVITLGGTNGKGSTAALLQTILVDSGFTVGAFTSPHVLHFNERITVNGDAINDEALCAGFVLVRSIEGSEYLSYFEFIFLVTLSIFKTLQLDYVLLEVGLGGRLDAVNIIDTDLAIITMIDFDHQDWLGHTLKAIATEKSGIMRAHKPIVYGGLLDSEASKTIIHQAALQHAILYHRNRDFFLNMNNEITGLWTWSGCSADRIKKKYDHLLATDCGIDNAVAVIQALQLIPDKITKKAINYGLTATQVLGRLQSCKRDQCGESKKIICDVAHNVSSIMRLINFLQKNPVIGKTHIILSFCDDKDYKKIIQLLNQVVDIWVLCEFESERVLHCEKLAMHVTKLSNNITIIPNIVTAFHSSIDQMDVNDRLVVTGSFMTVAAVLPLCQTA